MVPQAPDHSGTSDPGRCRRSPGRACREFFRGSPQPSFALQNSPAQGRKGRAMISAEIKTLASIGDTADQNGLMRPEIVARIGFGQLAPEIAMDRRDIEYGCGQLADGAALLPGDVARHSQ